MKKFTINIMVTTGLLFILIGLVLIRKDDINTIINKYLSPNRETVLTDVNKYYREYDFKFVQNTNDFSPNNYQDLLNIYYTVINSGKDLFTFYCDSEYTNCIDDVSSIANDKGLLSDINNFVHPYNAYSNIETEYDSLGKITIKLSRNYTEKEIEKINNRVDELYKEFYDYLYNNKKIEDVLYEIKRDSRRFAKRQYTFFNHQFNTTWFDVDFNNFNNTIEEVYNYIK